MRKKMDKNDVKVMYNICRIYRGVGHKMFSIIDSPIPLSCQPILILTAKG